MHNRIRRDVLMSMICLVWPVYAALAQNSPLGETSLAKTQQAVVHEQQLTDCRAGILDPQGRPAERRRWARTLLSYDTPQARAMIIDILSLDNHPKAQSALCSVIQQRVSQSTDLGNIVLVGPLLELLDAPSAEARQAAAAALAAFRQGEVIEKLGALCTDESAPITKRMAAIDALAPNIDRVDVVGQLIAILEVESPTVMARALAALSPATPQPFGENVKAWQTWWAEKSQLGEQAWLVDRLRLYLGRLATVEDEYRTYRERAEQHRLMVTAKLREYQLEIFALSSPDQRDAKIIAWLSDPVTVVKLVALGIIKGHIADEGRRPSDDVLNSLLILLRDESTVVRQEVLIIVQTLVDPKIEKTLLARLDEEHDPTTRETLLRAIGRLDSAAAIPFLVREIDAPDSLAPCVREAAIALGQTASMLDDIQRSSAADALKRRYAQVQESDIELRAALLSAMAGVADAHFEKEFQTSVDATDSVIVRPSIQGLVALGDKSRNARLRALCADVDALVRRDAVEALGNLGQEDADLEGVLSRLNPTNETNELVRDAAWQAFLHLLSNKAPLQKFNIAARLRDFPSLEIRYLTKLSDEFSRREAPSEVLEKVNERLIKILLDQDKCTEAAPYHQRLYDHRIKLAQTEPNQNHDVDIVDAGRTWLLTVLDCPGVDAGSVVSYLLATSKDASARNDMIATMATWVDGQDWSTQLDRWSTMTESFRSITPQPPDEAWTQLVQRMSKQLNNRQKPTSPNNMDG